MVPGRIQDFPVNVQQSARLALPALMREAGIQKKISIATPSLHAPNPRQTGLYVTELVAHSGSHSFETRAHTGGAYGFVGLTNFSIRESYSGRVLARDPRSANPGSPSQMKLPNIVLGPRESLLLPLRVPLAALIPSAPAGLASADEVYLLHCGADSRHLRRQHFEIPFQRAWRWRDRIAAFTPSPYGRLDGELVRFTEDAEHLLRVKIRKGHSPEYERTLAIEYLSAEPRIVFQGKDDGIAGEPHTVRMMIYNPRRSAFSGELVLRAGRLQTSGSLSVSLPPQVQPGG